MSEDIKNKIKQWQNSGGKIKKLPQDPRIKNAKEQVTTPFTVGSVNIVCEFAKTTTARRGKEWEL